MSTIALKTEKSKLGGRTHDSSKTKMREQPSQVRLQITLGKDSIERLERLREHIEPSTRTQVFRVALRLLEDVIKQLDNGNELLLRDKTGAIHPYGGFLV
jgi:Ribbon-helix-helix protein, copG family